VDGEDSALQALRALMKVDLLGVTLDHVQAMLEGRT